MKSAYYCPFSSQHINHIEPKYIKYYELDTQQFYNFLSRTEYQNPIYKSPVFWKGEDAVIIQNVFGETEELSISYYGSFFRIHGEPGYYIFTNNTDANQWLSLFKDLRLQHRSHIDLEPNLSVPSY